MRNLSVTILALSSFRACESSPSSLSRALYKAGVACICQAVRQPERCIFSSENLPNATETYHPRLSHGSLRLWVPMATLTIRAHTWQDKPILESLHQLPQVEIKEVLDSCPLVRIVVHLPCSLLHECMRSISSVTADTATFAASAEFVEKPLAAMAVSMQTSGSVRQAPR